MRKVAQKFIRDNQESKITSMFKSLYPNFEYEHRLLKMPIFPKIVVYSNVASVDRYLEE